MAREQKKRSNFDEYLTPLSKDAGILQFDFYSEAKITKPFFSDMLIGRTNPPPREPLEPVTDVPVKQLPSDEKRRTEFINRAAIGKGEIPCDISDMILGHSACRDRLRISPQTMRTAKR